MHDNMPAPSRQPRRWAAGLVLALSLSLPAAAQDTAGSPTLRDAWLQLERQPPSGYAVLRREKDVAHQARQGRQLVAELSIAARQAAQHGNLPWAHALQSWHRAVATYQQAPDQARTPGRADITALVASPRHNPRLSTLASFGACQPPAWVEVWHIGGVTRLPYRPGLSLDQALSEASGGEASRQSDTAWQITPLGRVREVGIAAWNLQPTEITPGSRIVQRLPLPLDGIASPVGAAWIDATLPHYLATRLPGEQCTLYSPTLPTSDR